tara:strand:- start:244 stop:510 length:267 start_codon:yes stop_codon:yes gene_type:complete
MNTNQSQDTNSSNLSGSDLIQTSEKPLGESIKELAVKLGGTPYMDEDNKKMLDNLSKIKTNSETMQTLLTDPNTGITMSYAESRSRFG